MEQNMITNDLGDAEDVSTAALIASLAQHTVRPWEVSDGDLYIVHGETGPQLLPTPGFTADWNNEHGPGPKQIDRSVVVRDAFSLIDYITRNTDQTEDGGPAETEAAGLYFKHGRGELEMWADLDSRSIVGILDGIHGWRMNKAELSLRHSIEWKEWSAVDGNLLGQVEFSQFVEDHLSSIGAPDGGKLLEICQSLEATTKVSFKSSELLANGQRKFRYEETTEAKAGQKSDLVIPSDLTLVVRPFQGSEPVAMTARFRYRLNGDTLLIGVKLVEPDRVLEEAFDAIVATVQANVPVRVNYGLC